MIMRESENDGRSGGRQASCVREGRGAGGWGLRFLFSIVAGVADPGRGAERFFEPWSGCVEVVSEPLS
jgi:hypothetical protein